ncbi:unnamed protein product [Haemonchus placei]|uniref:Ovule protein n=1 Tax=Haemonchus placei TaxID=6290 RepID=A0A0N4VZW3_HAEPC|nr:unnamed protein product [Haemonchus placei]
MRIQLLIWSEIEGSNELYSFISRKTMVESATHSFWLYRSNLKRSSHSLSDSGTDMAEDTMITTPLTVIKDAEMMCTNVIEDNNNVDRMKKVTIPTPFSFRFKQM